MMITSKYISALLLQLYIIIFLCLNFYTCTVYNIMFIIVPMSSTFVFNLRMKALKCVSLAAQQLSRSFHHKTNKNLKNYSHT